MRFISSLSKSIALLACVVSLVIGSLVFSNPAQAANYTVTMGAGGLQFGPKKVAVKPGDTVTFKNGMLAPHNVMFNPANSPDSELSKSLSHKQLAFKAGESFDVNIPADATPGDYEFFCTPHRGAGMVGHIVVE
ncbi:plastocyanin [Hydrocoleum sp. CS-953]|uniref:plastocyanin n=1 Tax=Hydrocoleum sp. CS-953 TaxID=1671698 RepID=UPI000B9B1F87|nr:plastocyanin [Hydrocoleum sp. CS-953]OZH54267.1 plastocyanin [Hydrocoleum sp. CS-953]